MKAAVLGLGLLASVGLALLAAGCGGSSGSGAKVAQVGTTGTRTTTGADSRSGSSEPSPTAYSACMRRHGVPSFPDPDAQGRFPRAPENEHTPAFEAARDACKSLRRPMRRMTEAEAAEAQRLRLAYSRCMREHRVENFPDTKPAKADRINPDSPAFHAADKACNHFLREVPDR